MTRAKIFFVLSAEQREQYADELAGLQQQPGAEFMHYEDADEALAQVGALAPRLIIVGMEVGPMEGLEFLALLMKANPGFANPVVVLPARGDPFPPVVHQRQAAGARSDTENIDLDGLRQLVAQAAEGTAAPAPAATLGAPAPAAATPAPAPATATPAPAPAAAAPAPEPPAASPASGGFEFLNATDRLPTPPKPKWPLFAGIGAVIAIGIVLGLLLIGGDKPPAADGDPGATAPTTATADAGPPPATAAPDGAVATAADAGGEPAAPEPDAAAAAEPAAPAASAAALQGLHDLPLRFPVGEASFEGEAALKDSVARYRTALAQHPGFKLEVGGHTSDEGATALNRKLGRARAQKVLAQLVALGIPAARVVIKNYGSRQPAASNDTPEGRQQNRRVTLRLVK